MLTGAVVIRALMSWFPISPYNRFSIILFQITEPVLAPIRRVIPRIGTLDISPMIAIVLLQVVVRIIAFVTR